MGHPSFCAKHLKAKGSSISIFYMSKNDVRREINYVHINPFDLNPFNLSKIINIWST